MNRYPPEDRYYEDAYASSAEPILAELVPEPVPRPVAGRRRGGRSAFWRYLPFFLFPATCLTTLLVGWINFESLYYGFVYAACLMTILLCHEMGHYLQARRYRVPATLPFFLPVPIPPIGTMGAVIAMQPGVGNRKAIFDIGITGPLAGLVPTMIFCVVGLRYSYFVTPTGDSLQMGFPLLMQAIAWLALPLGPDGFILKMHPMAFAAWVGLLITSLNLIPIGQLDGGHVLYALLRKRAHRVASTLLMAATVAVVFVAIRYHYPIWVVMILLLLAMGPNHPPTANDNVPLGAWRVVLGWLTLAFVLVGFTPMPFKM